MASSPRPDPPDFELVRFRIMTDMQEELTRWAKRRFSIVAVAIAAVGFFGFTTLLNQVIQQLVSSNVKSSVDNEIIRMTNTFKQAQELAGIITNEHLKTLTSDFALATKQLETARSEATEQTISLRQATQDAHEAANNAREIASKTAAEIENINSAIAQVSEESIILRDEYNTLAMKYGEFGQGIVEKVLKIMTIFYRSARKLDNVSDLLSHFEATMETILKLQAQKNHMISSALTLYVDEREKIASEFKEKLRQFENNSQSKVLIFVRRGQGLTDGAEMLADKLRTEGFEAEVWLTTREDLSGALSDLEYYFPDIGETLLGNKEGFVYQPGAEARADVIADVLSTLDGYRDIGPIEARFDAAEDVSRSLGGTVLPSSDLFLIYRAGE